MSQTIPNPCYLVRNPSDTSQFVSEQTTGVLVFSSKENALAYLDACDVPDGMQIVRGSREAFLNMNFTAYIVDPNPPTERIPLLEHGTH